MIIKKDKDFQFKKFRIMACIENINHDITLRPYMFICHTCGYAEPIGIGDIDLL